MAKKEEVPEKLKPFVFHGFTYKVNGTQARGDCPICGKEHHFYVKIETGQFDCKSCGAEGNGYSFLRQLHADRLESTTEEDYEELSQYRGGIPWEIYRDVEIAKDGKEWLIPNLNEHGNICNLEVWGGPGSKYFGTEGVSQHLYGIEIFSDPKDPRLTNKDVPFIICEGRWDAIALFWAIRHIGQEDNYVIFGTPGTTFKDDWVERCRGRKTILLMDNDGPGTKFMDRLEIKLANVVSELSRIQWKDDVKEGGDVNDWIAERLENPEEAVAELFSMLVPGKSHPLPKKGTTVAIPSPENKPVERIFKSRPKWEQVIAEYRKALKTTPEMEEAIAVLFATIFSNQLPDLPLWTFLVGPSGSGKTLVLFSLGQHEGCFFQSKLKPQLVSGWNNGPNPEDDPSVLRKMIGKTVIVEDFTQNLSMPASVQAELFSTLRGAYNGKVQATFHTGLVREYEDCRFSMIAGVTTVINSFCQTDMGERFIKTQFLDRKNLNEFELLRDIDKSNPAVFLKNQARLTQVANEFLDYKVDVTKMPKLPALYRDRIIRLAQLVTFFRGTVKRLYGGDVAYENERELGTRVFKQFRKLAWSLAITFGKTAVDEKVFRIIESVALSTSQGYMLKVAIQLIGQGGKPVDINQLELLTGMDHSNLDRRLKDMIELQIVERDRMPHKGRGQPAYGYRISEEVYKIWKQSGIRTQLLLNKSKKRKSAV